MAHAPARHQDRPHRDGATPWVIFVVAMVLVLTAVLAFLFSELRASEDQTDGSVKLGLPTAPAFKMPPRPPILPH